MKKLMKSKIAVAVLAVAIVASVLLSGTYSWFVRTSDGMFTLEENAFATLTAAQFSLIEGSGSDFNATSPEWVNLAKFGEKYNDSNILPNDPADLQLLMIHWGYEPSFGTVTTGAVVDCDCTDEDLRQLGEGEVCGHYIETITVVPDVIFPGEGIRYTFEFDADDFISVTNNREVVVAVDFSDFADLVFNPFNVGNPATGASSDNVYFETSVTFVDEDGEVISDDDIFNSASVEKVGSIYYFILDAGEVEGVAQNILENDATITLTVAYGLIGLDKDVAPAPGYQNNYMGAEIIPALDNATAAELINITVVQATPAAVADVFGPGVRLIRNNVDTAWSLEVDAVSVNNPDICDECGELEADCECEEIDEPCPNCTDCEEQFEENGYYNCYCEDCGHA